MSTREAEVDPTLTYAPDATECQYGHHFASEADCFLPEDWDHSMCRRCIDESGLTDSEIVRSLEAS